MTLKTKIHIAIFCTGCKILITLLTSTVVEYCYLWKIEDVQKPLDVYNGDIFESVNQFFHQ